MDVITSPEVNSLLPEQKFNRRSFLVTSLATGFALAVQPVSAQTNHNRHRRHHRRRDQDSGQGR